MADFLSFFKEENVSAAVTHNEINMFYVISHYSYNVSFIVGDSCLVLYVKMHSSLKFFYVTSSSMVQYQL